MLELGFRPPLSVLLNRDAPNIEAQPEIGARFLNYNMDLIAQKEPVYGLFSHSFDTACISVRLAKECGFGGAIQSIAARAGLLHDVGKVSLSDELFTKGPLSEEEMGAVRKHVEIGSRIIAPIFPLESQIIETSHKFQSRPYPDWAIPAREGSVVRTLQENLSIADKVTSLRTTGRSYKKPWTDQEIFDEISKFHYNPVLIEAAICVILPTDENC